MNGIAIRDSGVRRNVDANSTTMRRNRTVTPMYHASFHPSQKPPAIATFAVPIPMNRSPAASLVRSYSARSSGSLPMASSVPVTSALIPTPKMRIANIVINKGRLLLPAIRLDRSRCIKDARGETVGTGPSAGLTEF